MSAEEDDDLLLFSTGHERHIVTVNDVCHQSPLVTWKSDRDEYYHVTQTTNNESKMPINLPINYVSPFEIKHQKLTSATKWEHRLPIPPYVLSELDLRMELEKTKAELRQAHASINELERQINLQSPIPTVVPARPVSPTKGFGTFDKRSISGQLSSSPILM